MRKVIGFFFACALVVGGLSAILYILFEGGRAMILIGGIVFLLGGLYWLKEDYIEPLLARFRR
jgi:hypothetical protein